MTAIETPVVAGVDGSPDSRAAVDLAAWEADRRGLPLRLVHGVVPPAAYGPTFSAARLSGTELAHARGLLDDTVAEVAVRYPRLPVTGVAVVQGPAGLLVDESRAARLLVLGSRGHGGLTRLLNGSVSGQVAAYAHAPVIVVRERDQGRGGGPVVVGVDGSPGSAAALAFAVEEADGRGVPLIAVYAWQRRRHDPDEVREAAQLMLAKAVAGWAEKYPDLTVRQCAVDGADPADSLREAATGAGLLVVGCRGHGGFAALLLGSVSQALAGHAPAPVAIVHTH
jgi:nucleotide-binding universal stress UspA family protein